MLLEQIIKKTLDKFLEEREEDKSNELPDDSQSQEESPVIKSDITLFHWSPDENLSLEKIDPFRIGTSQSKKRYFTLPDLQKPAGLYTTISPNSFYGRLAEPSRGPNDPPIPPMTWKKNLYVINMKNVRFFDGRKLGATTDRISQSVLMELKDDGYDVIVGRGMIGEPEFIILNKNKIVKITKVDEEMKKQLMKKYGGVRQKYKDEDIEKLRSQVK